MGYERGHCYSLLLYTWALQIVTESESPVNSVGKPGVRAQSSSPGTQLPLPPLGGWLGWSPQPFLCPGWVKGLGLMEVTA